VLSTLFDGMARHTSGGRWFEQLVTAPGFHAAVGATIPEGGNGRHDANAASNSG
jgi:hypothetical protein